MYYFQKTWNSFPPSPGQLGTLSDLENFLPLCPSSTDFTSKTWHSCHSVLLLISYSQKNEPECRRETTNILVSPQSSTTEEGVSWKAPWRHFRAWNCSLETQGVHGPGSSRPSILTDDPAFTLPVSQASFKSSFCLAFIVTPRNKTHILFSLT